MLRILPLFTLLCVPPAIAQSPAADACASLRSRAVESATVTLAESVVSGKLTTPYGETLDVLPAFCRVAGTLRPTVDSVIRFEVWLPVAGWNGRFLGVGNGGFAGTINYGQLASSLRSGFATASTDTGHEAGAEDASWAFHHPEKIADYGFRALHLTTLRAKEVVAAFYGKPATHAYFDSCSNGGREALMEAQRFPEDYDGILAGAPANNWTRMLSSAVDVAHTMTGDPTGYIPAMKLPAIHRAVLEACDSLDGIRDGIVSDPSRCRFDPTSLQCKGEDSLDCLTAPQLATLKKIYSGGSTRDGKLLFPGYTPGSELPGWDYWVMGTGPGAGAGARYPVNYFRYMVYSDPKWEILSADPAAALAQADVMTAHDLNATDADLKPFLKRGKLILYHGWNDAAISPWNTIEYVRQVRTAVGAPTADSSLRLYMVPGMEHCAGGPGPSSFGQLGLPNAAGPGTGALDALERWVETGTAPDAILAATLPGRAPSAAQNIVRPLCPYPQTAVYNATGDANHPGSFNCKAP